MVYNAENNNDKFIGTGYSFPIMINSQGRPSIVRGLDLIKSSINLLLGWPKGQRFFKEDFGSLIDRVLEEPNDSITRTMLITYVKEAIQDYEKRIIVNKVTIENVNYTTCHIIIDYVVRNSKVEDTLIYPYYKEIS